MLRWVNSAECWASARKRARKVGSPVYSLRSTLTATGRPSSTSRARQPCPIPPVGGDGAGRRPRPPRGVGDRDAVAQTQLLAGRLDVGDRSRRTEPRSVCLAVHEQAESRELGGDIVDRPAHVVGRVEGVGGVV